MWINLIEILKFFMHGFSLLVHASKKEKKWNFDHNRILNTIITLKGWLTLYYQIRIYVNN